MAIADPGAKVSELATRYVSDNMRSWQRYAEELRRVSESVMPGAPSAAKTSASPGDVPAFARQLMQLNFAHYSKLLNSYAEFTTGIIDAVFPSPDNTSPAAATPAAAPAPPPAPVVSRIELAFSGATGETVSQPFAVANKKAEPIDVAFEVSEFASENGGSRFRVPVTFVPDAFVLSPGAERIVECRVPLVQAFLPGARYMALVRVIGFPSLETALIVLPTDEARGVADYDKRVAATPPIDATVVGGRADGRTGGGADERSSTPANGAEKQTGTRSHPKTRNAGRAGKTDASSKSGKADKGGKASQGRKPGKSGRNPARPS